MEAVDGSQYPLRLGILIKRSQANPFIQTERHSTRRDTSSEAQKKKQEIPGGGAAKGKRATRDPQKRERGATQKEEEAKKQKQKQKKFPFVRRRSDTSSDATCQQQLPERPKRDVRSRAGRDGDDGERGIEAAGSFRPVFFFCWCAAPWLPPPTQPSPIPLHLID